MVDPRSVLRYTWLEGNSGNAEKLAATETKAGSAFRRVKSLPAFNPAARRSVVGASSMAEPPALRAHLWKKTPGMHLFRYQWRYVVLKDAHLHWWSTMEASEQEAPKGSIDFTINTCEVFPDEGDQCKFVLRPRMGHWKKGSFTGAKEGRVFSYDCRDSEFNRVSWLEAIHAHLRYGEAKRRRGDAKAVLTKLLHPGADAAELEKAIHSGIAANVDKATLEFAAQQLRAKTGIEIDTGTSPFTARASRLLPTEISQRSRALTVFNVNAETQKRAASVDHQFQRRLSDSVAHSGFVESHQAPHEDPCDESEKSDDQDAQSSQSENPDLEAFSLTAVTTQDTTNSLLSSDACAKQVAESSEEMPSKLLDMQKAASMASVGTGDETKEKFKHCSKRMTLHKDMSDGPVWNELREKLNKRRSTKPELDQIIKLEAENS